MKKILIRMAFLGAVAISVAGSYYLFKMKQSTQWKMSLSDRKTSNTLYYSANDRVFNSKDGMEFLIIKLSIENLSDYQNQYSTKDVVLTDDIGHTAYPTLGIMLPGVYDHPGLEIAMGSYLNNIRVDSHKTITSEGTTFAFLVPKNSHDFKVRLCVGADWLIPLSCDTPPIAVTK